MTDLFYETIALRLKNYMKRENITTSQLGTRVDQQYNTITGILEGRRFQAHHTIWLSKIIDLHIEKGDSGDNQQHRIEDFI